MKKPTRTWTPTRTTQFAQWGSVELQRVWFLQTVYDGRLPSWGARQGKRRPKTEPKRTKPYRTEPQPQQSAGHQQYVKTLPPEWESAKRDSRERRLKPLSRVFVGPQKTLVPSGSTPAPPPPSCDRLPTTSIPWHECGKLFAEAKATRNWNHLEQTVCHGRRMQEGGAGGAGGAGGTERRSRVPLMSAPVTNTKVKLDFGQPKAKNPCRLYHMCVVEVRGICFYQGCRDVTIATDKLVDNQIAGSLWFCGWNDYFCERIHWVYIYMCNSIGFGNLSNFANWLGFRGSLTKWSA